MDRDMKEKLDRHITGNYGEDQFENQYFDEPKSWCYCGHLGDGLNSQHSGINGHGRCEANGCDCEQFTWKRFTNRFNEWYAKKEGTPDGKNTSKDS